MAKHKRSDNLPMDGPGYQVGTDVRRIRWTVGQAIDRVHQQAQNVLDPLTEHQRIRLTEEVNGGIDAIGLVFVERLVDLENRLQAVHRLFTERQVATTIQAKWFQAEVKRTEAVLAESADFRLQLQAEREADGGRGAEAETASDCAEEPDDRRPA